MPLYRSLLAVRDPHLISELRLISAVILAAGFAGAGKQLPAAAALVALQVAIGKSLAQVGATPQPPKRC
jgi:hypothetical protein